MSSIWLAAGTSMKMMRSITLGKIFIVTITFASWEYMKMSLNVGDEFEVRETGRIVGYGKVVTIF
ncbi:hypothetical protein SOASR030_26580 [Leminorella grimontii]|uniref:Uncharacterized protein n=1 Tax=Leminorella grimontii TaxID=82981 RepID=A0AAV5N395_9GAMM|nr:hypothetical protein SOASR030_26580 [Leminorella grimontii]VFS61609.1 Uncharacterised protein [Leminorella grimontii]